MRHRENETVLQSYASRAADRLTHIYSLPLQQQNLIDYRSGLIALILGELLSIYLFLAEGKTMFLILSLVTIVMLSALVHSAHRTQRVTALHYAAATAITYLFGLAMFSMLDNARGVYMFGLAYPVLAIFILKGVWGNLLIAAELVTSMIAGRYVNNTRWETDMQSIFSWIYIMFWIYSNVMEEARAFLVRRLQAQQKELEYYADYDHLTKLANRRMFYRNLEEQYPSEPEGVPAALILMDIDNFKLVNDTYGHEIGDQVLAQTAARIRSSTRDADICCRWGGEEFLVLARVNSGSTANTLAQRICDAIGSKKYVLSDGREMTNTVSVGVVYAEHFCSSDAADAVRAADENLYRAKNAGKNRVCSSVFRSST